MEHNEFWKWFDGFAGPQLQHREASFRMAFDHLCQLQRPVCIVETGCVRNIGTFAGEGQSTALFDKFSEWVPGTVVHSVDIDPKSTELCRGVVSSRVQVHTSDSVAFLRHRCAGLISPFSTIDLLYLDSYDVDVENPHDSALHHLKELLAAASMVTPKTLILVDDSPTTASYFIDGAVRLVSAPRVGGKGKYISNYMESIGARVLYHGYQVAWLGT